MQDFYTEGRVALQQLSLVWPRIFMTALPSANTAEPNPFKHYFKFRYLLLYFLGISISLGMVVSFYSAMVASDAVPPHLLLILNAVVMILMSLLLLNQMHDHNMPVDALLGGWPKLRSWWVLVMVLPVMLFSLGSGQLYFYLVAQLFPNVSETLFNSPIEISTSGNPLWKTLLSTFAIAAVAPFTEEFVFRGILLHRWAAKLGIVPAAICSSLLFGLLHPNPVGLSVFGLAISLIYLRTRSLWIAIAFHAINNGTVVVLELLSSSATTFEPIDIQQQLSLAWKFGCLLVALSSPFLLLFFQQYWPKRTMLMPYLANRNHS